MPALTFLTVDTISAWSKLRFGRVEAFKQARSSFAAKSRSMLGLQIATPGFGRENPRIHSHIAVKDPGRSLLYKRCARSPDSHLTRLVAMSSLIAPLSELKALLASGLISEELYTTHCERLLSALHDHPPETPPQPNAANAANAAKPPQTTSPSKSERSMAMSMAYSDPDGLAEFGVQLSSAELAGLDIKSQSSNGSALTQVFVPSSASPELSPGLPVSTPLQNNEVPAPKCACFE